MGRPQFDFKQFSIRQEHCAMKVCTDACIFGAWVANKLTTQRTILDIGTGTGLLMLMLAQKTTAHIQGIEIDLNCEIDLKQNINSSPWAERLSSTLGDARSALLPQKCDLIISNPPFFENYLPAKTRRKNIAKHSTHLTFEQLLQIALSTISERAHFAVLLPYSRKEEFENIAFAKGFSLIERLSVRESLRHDFFRSCDLYEFTADKGSGYKEEELIIRDGEGNYTPDFTELLKDYYLYL